MRTVDVPAARLARWLAGFRDRHGEVSVETDAEQVRLRGSDGAWAWIAVPFGPLPPTDAPDVLDALCAHVNAPRTIGVLLARRRAHAVGVFAGSTLTASKVGTNYVQGTTRAGGWSQQRFARRRANQAQAAAGDAADDAVRVLLPHRRDLDGLVCGGDRAAVEAILADQRLRDLLDLRREPFLTVPDPRLRVLAATPERFTAVRIHLEP
jgi:hypothetical protein